MALASGVMGKIADLLGRKSLSLSLSYSLSLSLSFSLSLSLCLSGDSRDYWDTHKALADPRNLDSLHWDRHTMVDCLISLTFPLSIFFFISPYH